MLFRASTPPNSQLLFGRLRRHQSIGCFQTMYDPQGLVVPLLSFGQIVVGCVYVAELGLTADSGKSASGQESRSRRNVVRGSVNVPMHGALQVFSGNVLLGVQCDLEHQVPAAIGAWHALGHGIAETGAEGDLLLVGQTDSGEHEHAVALEL